jgi:hypothetical protein
MGGDLRCHPQALPEKLKKRRKTRIFPFDLGKSPPYNPRPRCFAATGYEVVLPVDFMT